MQIAHVTTVLGVDIATATTVISGESSSSLCIGNIFVKYRFSNSDSSARGASSSWGELSNVTSAARLARLRGVGFIDHVDSQKNHGDGRGTGRRPGQKYRRDVTRLKSWG